MHFSVTVFVLLVPVTYILTSLIKSSKTLISLANINGPKSPSWFLGNLLEYYQSEVGAKDFVWQEKYGTLYRIKGLFNSDRLMVSDPKALQHIAQNFGGKFIKPVIRRELGRLFLGRGIAWAEGDDHKRHRKILAPAFRNVEVKSMVPVIWQVATKMCDMWNDKIEDALNDGTAKIQSATLDVSDGLYRATFDTTGEVAFDYKFDTLDNTENKFAQLHASLLVDTYGLPSAAAVFVQQSLMSLSQSAFNVIAKLPSKSLGRLRAVSAEGNKVAQELVDKEMEAISDGKTARETLLSLLVKSNSTEDINNRLTHEELLAQIRVIIAAGHDTTSSSISFLLYDLAKHPDIQEKVRAEISKTLETPVYQKSENGTHNVSLQAMESMRYTIAVMKESLRLNSVIYGPFVEVAEDGIIPLSEPITARSGKSITEVPVGKGQIIHLSICGYNRLPSVWGDDAHSFRPERWLDATHEIKSPFGVYANLGNFFSGSRSCLGWRLAILEIQIFMIEVIRRFKLSVPTDSGRILRTASGVMAPVVEGQLEKGKQLPLTVTLLR